MNTLVTFSEKDALRNINDRSYENFSLCKSEDSMKNILLHTLSTHTCFNIYSAISFSPGVTNKVPNEPDHFYSPSTLDRL